MCVCVRVCVRVCVCNDECMCIVRLINNTILVLMYMYVDVRLVTDYILSLLYTRHKNAKNAAQH